MVEWFYVDWLAALPVLLISLVGVDGHGGLYIGLGVIMAWLILTSDENNQYGWMVILGLKCRVGKYVYLFLWPIYYFTFFCCYGMDPF